MRSQNRGAIPLGLGVAVMLALFVLGLYVGYTQRSQFDAVLGVAHKETPATMPVDFEPFWKVWNLLNDRFVPNHGTSTNPTVATPEDRVWGAISGLTRALGDPYTVFLPPVQNEIFNGDIKGNFEGVGMEIGVRDDVLTVIAPLKDSPAEHAGLRSGDKIIKINGQSTSDMTVEDAVSIIRGERGSVVVFQIYREGENDTHDISVTRDVITIPTLTTTTKTSHGKKVFVISLYNFSEPSADLFRDALSQFAKSGTDKLVIDLRGNPGGFMDAAIDMASYFIPEGKVIVREYLGEGKDERVHRSKGYGTFEKAKVVLLIDQGSASASEILAGALSEQKQYPLVGQKSFGKGSVQELIPITEKTSLKVTIARWLTPNGLSISGQGLTPNYLVTKTQEDAAAGRDPQMDKALELLTTS